MRTPSTSLTAPAALVHDWKMTAAGRAAYEEELRAQNDQLEQMRETLRESHQRYVSLFDFAPTGYVTLDHEGVIREINLTGVTLLGATRFHLLGLPLRIFVVPDDREAYSRHLMQCRHRAGRFSTQLRIRSRVGRIIPVAMLSDVATLPSGKARIRMALSDMTQYEEAQQQKREAHMREQSARIAAETKDRLVAMVSHELRTPLSSIMLWARVLSKKIADDAACVQALQGIVRGAEAQRLIIDDLLDTSRITSGKLRLEPRPTDLSALFISAIGLLMPAADNKRIALEARVLAEIGWVQADPTRLRQIIWNLITNAIKFTDAGGQIKVTLSRMDSDVYIVVRNTGRGIDRTFLPQLFEPFRQADSAVSDRVFGGLGLGLSISQQLARLHGGHIEAASDGPGCGAVFTVQLRLPVIRDRAHSADLPGDRFESATSQTGQLRGLHILLVEDEPSTRAALQTLVQDAGAEVIAVASVRAAIDAFKTLRPDLIVGDIGIPEEDGYSLIRRVREIERAQGVKPVPAIALTAFTQDSDREKALAAGFDRHMGKPVEFTKLLSTVRSLVRESGPA